MTAVALERHRCVPIGQWPLTVAKALRAGLYSQAVARARSWARARVAALARSASALFQVRAACVRSSGSVGLHGFSTFGYATSPGRPFSIGPEQYWYRSVPWKALGSRTPTHSGP